jgi:hypothetical protein
MPYKRAMTEKALAEAGKNEFADRVKNAEAVGLLPGTPAYQAFLTRSANSFLPASASAFSVIARL